MVAEMITKIGIPSDAELFLRVIVASVLGYMIGYERKNRDKSAGMRTHAIVALGAALMMVVSKYGFYDVEKVDSSRVAAQIVSGVGFLGAGVIFVRNNTVSGLTTAAGLWTTAGVGMARTRNSMIAVFFIFGVAYSFVPEFSGVSVSSSSSESKSRLGASSARRSTISRSSFRSMFQVLFM